MPPHAGFAAVIGVQQSMLQDMVRVVHHANRLPHSLRFDWGLLAADLFLDAPELVCARANKDRVALTLRAWGRLTFDLPFQPAETRLVLFKARVLAPPLLTLEDGKVIIQADAPNTSLDSYQIDVLSGGPFSQAVQNLLDSFLFRTALENQLRAQLEAQGALVPPLTVSFLGPIVTASNIRLCPRLFDGVLVIGLDLTGGTIQTAGDPTQLTDVSGGRSLGMWINPVAVPLTLAAAHSRIRDAVAKQGASLDSLTITLEDGCFHISGSASKTGGSITFSMNAVPSVGQDLHFLMQDVQIDIHRDWWVTLLEALGGFFAIMVVEDIVRIIREEVMLGIKSSSGQPIAAGNQEFTLPGIPEPAIQVRLRDFTCSRDEGTFTGISLRPKRVAPCLYAGPLPFIEQIAAAPPTCRVSLPFDVLPDDPQLRIRWTVRRLDRNDVVLRDEGQAGPRLKLSLAPIVPIIIDSSHISVECRVYRVLGAEVQDLFNDTARLSTWDLVDRSHPYVRWHHWVYAPLVRVEVNGTQTVLGNHFVQRISAIHRTAVPGRCAMLRRMSVQSLVDPFLSPPPPPPAIEYLDDLPFPRAELINQRSQVCDYCFFGGPTRTQPLIPD